MDEIRTITIDASGRNLGRVATRAACELMGKTSPAFQKHHTIPVRVVIINASEVTLSGKKAEQKTYTRYSGYPGGLKRIPYQRTRTTDVTRPLRYAIAGMIPKNRLHKPRMKQLTIYANEART